MKKGSYFLSFLNDGFCTAVEFPINFSSLALWTCYSIIILFLFFLMPSCFANSLSFLLGWLLHLIFCCFIVSLWYYLFEFEWIYLVEFLWDFSRKFFSLSFRNFIYIYIYYLLFLIGFSFELVHMVFSKTTIFCLVFLSSWNGKGSIAQYSFF